MIYIPSMKYIYPIFILLSFIISFGLIFLRNKKVIKKTVLFYGFLVSFICSMFGGVIYHFITNLLAGNGPSFGISSYGGAIGLISSVFIYSKILNSETNVNIPKDKIDNLKEEFLLHIPLIYSISKIACGMTGCCYGFEYSGPLAVCYNGINSFFPVQFLETLTFLFIYIISITLLKKNNNKVLIMFIISAFCKTKLECLRYGYNGINTNQIVSYIFISISLVIIFIKESKKRSVSNE